MALSGWRQSFSFLFLWLLCAQQSFSTSDKETSGHENQTNNPIVRIPNLGYIRGSVLKTALNNREIAAFRGIPYAQPPIGELRFRDPVPVEPWNDKELDATKEGPSCVQYDSMIKQARGVEDCLVINVYTPKNGNADLYPVMVWIHGGGFIMGDGNGETGFYGPDYLLERDIVLVTFNYRLAAFGFLSTEDAEAPGNYGLLDQTLALKWVRDYIKHFGGNPDSITIFGESAGGASVEFQLLSPHSKGLFHRAIAQSGATTAPWALQHHVKDWTMILAQDVGCPVYNTTSKEVLACLRKVDAAAIAKFRAKIVLPYALELFPIAMGPRIDLEREKPFLPGHPLDLMAEGKFNKVPYITGVTKNEGILLTATLIGEQNEKNMMAFKFGAINGVRHIIGMEKRADGKEMAQLVHDKYLTASKPYETQIREIEQLASDSGFFKPFQMSTELLSSTNDQPVYTYFYSYRGALTLSLLIGSPPDPDNGVGHGDDLLLIFGSAHMPKLQLPDDLAMSETLIDLFTSFAINGIPESKNVNEKWNPYSNDQKSYLHIGGLPGEHPTAVKMIDGNMPFNERMAFWDDILFPPKTTLSDLSVEIDALFTDEEATVETVKDEL